MALTTVRSIVQALSLVDEKKQSLRKAFEELESRASSLSSLNFAWTDLDSYFSGVQSELLDKLSALQALKPSRTRARKRNRECEKRKDPFLTELVPARPQLKSLCEKMDALGLRKYVIDRPKERTRIRAELADACKHAPDAGSMVLDALQGFWDEKLRSGSRLRAACVVLLEELMRAGVEIGAEVRERAKTVAEEWRAKIAELNSGIGGEGDDDDWVLESLGYLQLLASYKLLIDDGFDANELVDYVALSARYRQTVHLCRVLGLESKISDVVQRLVSKGKQLSALKFIFQFELMDEFPPVPLLKAYLTDSKQFVQSKRGKSSHQNDAAMKESNELKSVIKCFKDHGLESQCPKDEMLMRIRKLKKEKAHMKRPVADPVLMSQQPPKIPKHTGYKRLKTAAGPSAFNRKHHGKSSFHPSQPSSVKRAGLFPDLAASRAYGMAGSFVAASPYVGSAADMYGVPSMSSSYTSEIHAQPPVYVYGGYDVSSHYPPVYYPQ